VLSAPIGPHTDATYGARPKDQEPISPFGGTMLEACTRFGELGSGCHGQSMIVELWMWVPWTCMRWLHRLILALVQDLVS
jgi:hypothetical protein